MSMYSRILEVAPLGAFPCAITGIACSDCATIARARSFFLVGHSYGGSVITDARTDDRAAGLVYIAAFAPDADETSQTQLSNFPKTDVLSHIEVADGRIRLLPEGIDSFAGDLSEQEKSWFGRPSACRLQTCSSRKCRNGLEVKPSWYVAKNDRTVQPDLGAPFAKRMGATTTEAASSHVVMLSQPQVVIDVIRKSDKSRSGGDGSSLKPPVVLVLSSSG